jgi:hypothetical protein
MFRELASDAPHTLEPGRTLQMAALVLALAQAAKANAAAQA